MKFNKKTLANGLRVITAPMKDNQTVTLLVLVEAGSKYETKEINGLSHFLEHMCFKGTKNRPRSIDISRELDSLGAQYNAFTSQEVTGYYVKAEKRHFDQILDVISDIYVNSVFNEAEIEREKGVIVEEINMYEDLPMRKVQELFSSLLYGDQPAGWGIAGKKEIVKKLKQQDFVAYKSKHYVATGTVVIVAGNINESVALGKIKKAFSEIESTRKHPKIKTIEKQKKPEILLEYKKTDQSHLVLGVRTFGILHKNNPILSVLSGVLSGGMSSRLFQKLREEMGVGYYVRAHNDVSTDHGCLQVSAGVDNKRVEETIQVILAELNKLKNELVPNEEIQKVKDYITGNLYLGLESSDSIADFYGEQEILKKTILKPEEIIEKINKVTAKDIQKVAREIFKDERLNLAMIGPEKEEKKFLPILGF